MGLLAGERRKQKISRANKTWANDNKSVQAMMQKMGWKDGAGLGANENGRVEPIKAVMKQGRLGVGGSDKAPDVWISHGDEFEQILASLNSSNKNENGDRNADSGRSTPKDEMEGQRRFYGRFSRGGVKQTRTAEDLNCIFGRKKESTPPVEDSKEEESKSEDSDDSKEDPNIDTADSKDDPNVDRAHGVETITSTFSVQDYFAQKLKKLKQNKKDDGDVNSTETDANDQGCDKQVTEKPNSDTEDPHVQDFNSYVTSSCSVQDYFSQKMKAKKAKLMTESGKSSEENGDDCGEEKKTLNGDQEVGAIMDLVEENCENDTEQKKKKKKKKRKTEDIEESEKDKESIADVGDMTDNLDCKSYDPNTEEKTEKRKKKKKRKTEDIDNPDEETTNLDSQIDEICTDEKAEKKKKKRKGENTEVQGGQSDGINELCTEQRTERKKKKRKAEDDVEVFDDSTVDANSMGEKSKKKKKKRKTES